MVTQHHEGTKCHRIAHFKIVKVVNFVLYLLYDNFFKRKEQGEKKINGKQ